MVQRNHRRSTFRSTVLHRPGTASTGISPYVELNEGNHQLAVTITGSGQQLIQRSVTLDGGKDYSFLVSGSLSSPEGVLASDTAGVPIPGKVKIRVLHAARGAPHWTCISPRRC
jgi:hypothetical protein